MTCIEQGLVKWVDVFMLGVVLGGITVIAAQILEKWANQRLELNRKKLDLELGKSLIAMQERLNDMNKGGKDAPHA